ncbi:MAG: hypothetical protein HYX32_14595 [Actinobacteria bacterium]|nr:hypothetical protein [Actinomycetota bacterium]
MTATESGGWSVGRDGIRLDAAPELIDIVDDLKALGLTDIAIVPVSVAGTTCWASEIFVENEYLQYAWALDLRPTKDEARAAVECLLRGLVAGRKQAIADHPAVAFLNDDDAQSARRAQQGALAQMEHGHARWRDRET